MAAGLKGRDMSKPRKVEIPEAMGAVCAVVYLLALIVFIPLPFYKYIVAATSGGGNKDVVLELEQVETGRLLHKFPHSKVGGSVCLSNPNLLLIKAACPLPLRHSFSPIDRYTWYRR